MNELKSVQDYKSQVRRDHESRVARKYFDLYAWFWFHTQFWIKDPAQRRPYTLIMRDWVYPNMPWFLVILGIWYGGLIVWHCLRPSLPVTLTTLILGTLSGWLCAHIVWGSKWIPNEQEHPPYLGE